MIYDHRRKDIPINGLLNSDRAGLRDQSVLCFVQLHETYKRQETGYLRSWYIHQQYLLMDAVHIGKLALLIE
jgi:hypothetical protein